ncbi:mechanosensitive ion channel family protein [Deinococcus peraridilitoris]|uniref:Small-conductance mechanosensitive channel n=1 Tax=Deinococcus peraridilitoris (strain DSM 19664 / LMG 22246 / CIP 109416 / KR-200) TaxID=937777 RepID=L0A3U5_DEIPD|nr:mechanosensitive ion channel family protein [Deinococcus peraridilitoris]AFZ68521.1 small-conductance mechanosensitive channel [Deinococcus peraridilitoris DSM 19664]
MLDIVMETLGRPGTWLVLVLYTVVLLGVWRIGMNMLELLEPRVPVSVVRVLRVVWSVGSAYVLAALIAQVIKLPYEPLYSHGREIAEWFRESAGRIVAVLVLAFVAWNLVSVVSSKVVPGGEFSRTSVRIATLKSVVESALRATIMVVALVTVLDNIGVRTGTLLAGVSVLGLAVSFGAQSLIKDVITGFFVLLEDQYGVGDVITVNGGTLSGNVERMNLRFTALRALDGTLHIIPNGQINTVSVMSKDWSRVVATVGLPPTADVNGALTLLEQVARELHADPAWGYRFLEAPTIDGVSMLTRDGFEVRALLKVLPKEQWALGREFNRRMKMALDDAGMGGLRPQLMVVRQEGANTDAGAAGALGVPSPGTI